MAEDLEDPHDADIFAPVRDASYKHIQVDTVQCLPLDTPISAP